VTQSPLVIKAGDTTAEITVALLDNNVYEDNKTVILTLSSPQNATLGAVQAHTILIADDDQPPQVSFALRNSEAKEGAGFAKLAVALSAVSGKQARVEYAVTGGSAIDGKDYTLKSGPLVFEPGETEKSIDIGVKDNKAYEDNRTIEVTLANPVNAVLGAQTVHTYTIIDDDPEPTVAFVAPGQEVKENGGSAMALVQLSNPSGKDVIVPFTISGTAVEGKNYRIMTQNPLVIKAGSTTAGITIVLRDDKQYEDGKTITVTLGIPVNAIPGERVSHTVTVLDVDAPPRIAIMPFANESGRKYAGEIMVSHFVRELIKGKHFAVIEPGLIREKLLDYRIIMYDGISLSDAELIAGELKADLILTGRVLDFRERTGGSDRPKVGFSLLLINRKDQRVVWSSGSRNEGNDAVYLFDWGKINTVQALAAEMTRAVGKMIMQR
jgi:TolB-like protein